MLHLLNKIFIKVKLIESKFSPDPPRNVAVQWIKIVLQNKAKSSKISEIVLHLQIPGLASMATCSPAQCSELTYWQLTQ